MKKQNLIAIGLGLFLLQPLYGQNPLAEARRAVDQVETALEADRPAAIAKAQGLIDKIPSKDKAIARRLQTRLNQASSRAYYGPGTAPAEMPSGTISARDFDNQMQQLKADVNQLEANWRAKMSTGTAGYYPLGQMEGGPVGDIY